MMAKAKPGKSGQKMRSAQRTAEVTHIKDLVPDIENRRTHNPRNIGMIVDALHKVGAARSIVIDEGNVILAGNGVTEAAAEAGITRVRVIDAAGDELIAVRRSGLTAAQKRELAIYDNRAAELAEWNPEQLLADQAAGLDLVPWFTAAELAALLPTEVKGGLTDPDEVPAERATDIVLGDMFELGRHRLLCGDSTKAGDVTRLMAGEVATAVVTDSPYGIGKKGIANDAEEGLRELFDGALAVLPVRNAVVINFQSPRLFPLWIDSVRAHGHQFERALWFYDETDVTFPWRGWLMTSQIALVSSVGKPTWPVDVPYHHDCYLVKTAGKQDDAGSHPTAKPVDIIQNLMGHTTGLLYEPFSGSGTAIVSAERMDRQCFAMELEPKYVQIAIDRFEQFTGQKAVKVGEAVLA